MVKTNIKLRVTPEQSKAVQKICFNNKIYWAATGSNFEEDNVRYIFIDIDDMTLTYDSTLFHEHKFEEINADLFIRTNGTCVESIDIVDNSSNNKSKEDIFKQYGFEVPDFECEILKYFEHDNTLVGYYKTKDGTVYAESWHSLNGRADSGDNKYDMQVHLTPIKKPWYETCKFPCLVKDEDGTFLISEIEWYSEKYIATLTPLTNDEIEGLKQ